MKPRFPKRNLRLFAISLALLGLLIQFTPLEKTLGENARIVYLHGAMVWVAILAFMAAGLVGLYGLLVRREAAQSWSRALGHTALFLWLIFLPMSLYVMQANWNGLFLDEPRFRIPLNFAVVGVLLQLGLTFLPKVWTSGANLVFALALAASLRSAETVLHPVSPVFGSGATGIQVYFVSLLVWLAFIAVQFAGLWHAWLEQRKG